MKKSRLLGAVCACALISIFSLPAHSAVIDQVNSSGSASFCFTGCQWQQEVVVGVSGSLAGLDIYYSGIATATFDIWTGSPLQSGAPIYSTTFTTSGGGATHIDLSAAAINLSVNDSFTFGLSSVSGVTQILGSNSATAGGNYSAGDLHFGAETSCFSDCGWDLAFTSYMSPVPIPAAAWLFGSGLLGLVGIARKKA